MKSKFINFLALAVCSYLPADAYTPPMEPQTELEQLTVIMAKYGNNPDDTQAINYAILMQDEAAIDLLLKYGAMPGQSSLEYARRAGSLDLLKKLFNLGVRADSVNNGLLSDAIRNDQNEIASYIIEQGSSMLGVYFRKNDRNYLTLCASFGNLDIYNLLVSKGATDRDPARFQSSLVSMYGTQEKHKNRKLKMVKYLLDNGVIDPNIIENGQGEYWDNSPILFKAADPRGGKYAVDMVRILLQKGAFANALYQGNNIFSKKGSPLLCMPLSDGTDEHFSVQMEMIQLLVDNGADINHKDSMGNTPLKYAKGTRLVEFLKSIGAE